MTDFEDGVSPAFFSEMGNEKREGCVSAFDKILTEEIY